GTLISSSLGGNTAAVGEGTWTQFSGPGTTTFSALHSESSTATASAYGTYVYRWTIANGTCASTNAELTVNYYETPTTATVGSDQDQCGTLTSSSLDGNEATVGEGTWTQVSGPGITTFSDVNSESSTATASAYGTYVYRWTIANGTCASTSAELTVNYYETPTSASVTVENQDQCGTLISSNLRGNEATVGEGTWTQISGPEASTTLFSNVNSESSIATASAYGTYVYRWTIANGTCASTSAELTVNYYETPTSASVTVENQDQCGILISSSLGGNEATVGEGSWTQISGPDASTTLFSNVNSESSIATASAYGTYVYRWTIANGTCASTSAELTVNYYETPTTATVGSDQDQCGTLISSSLDGNIATVGEGTWTQVSGPGTTTFSNINSESAIATVSAYGTYVYRWTIANGTCASTSAELTVNYYETPTTATVGSNQDQCGTLISSSLDGNKATVGEGIWTQISGPDASTTIFNALHSESSIATASAYGTYVYRWTIANGTCASTSAELTVNYYEQPTSNAGTGGNECGLDFTLSAVASVGTGTWTKTDGSGMATFSPNANTPTATVTVDAYDTYEFTWTEENGTCSDNASINVDFYQKPTINAGTGGNECGLDFTLSAVAIVGTGTWTKTDGSGMATFSPNANTPTATVTVDAYDTYEFTWTEVNGSCSDNASIDVTFYEQSVANAGTGGSECGLDFTLSAVASVGIGTWTKTGGSGTATFSPNANTPTATVTVDAYDTYQFTWTEENGTCSSSDDVTIHFYEQPQKEDDSFIDVCGLEYNLQESTALFSGEWVFNSGPGNVVFEPNSTSSDVKIRASEYGEYYISWEESNGVCEIQNKFIIHFYKAPIAFAGEDINLNYPEKITLNAKLSTDGFGEWTIISGSGNIYDTNSESTEVDGLSGGTNVFMWREINNTCEDQDTVQVKVDAFFIPTVITPNGDSKNDLFIIKGVDNIKRIELIIFNRRGNRVFIDTNYKNTWDGTDNQGKELNAETYFYVIKMDNNKVFKGSLVIKR
ncbi:gliding motility-associated C-terminal domain-containing protein, partial [Ancylomarina sp. 16SWW S1-10-2]|uniref:gliding motility-associated C-terminal domain-containing protein n=1 Tax=Ancylomarina sp. 16SWW S1-10-2 TaxID=2499681 RepID=UPI0012AE99F2